MLESAPALLPPNVRQDYRLTDNLTAEHGQVFITGTQALLRIMLDQRRRDAERGLRTAGFVSGYRGSPLGMVDQQMWKHAELLRQHDIDFLPAINEDLAAAACLGTQQVESDPARCVDGVFALWYGKGPGVDRAGDALKHGNASGSSPHGGVLVVAGDDHGCVSSSMPHQSDLAMQAWSMPVLHPANVAEYLEFGLYGFELSRFSGCWVGFKAISEVVESAMTVDLDRVQLGFEQSVEFSGPPDGLHWRASERPSPLIETRMAAKIDAVQAFARVNSIDRHVVSSPGATLGIVTVGKAHYDFLEVLRRLDLSLDELAVAGVRIYKVGLVWPLEPTRLVDFSRGLSDILVIEEKAPIVETQIRNRLYDFPDFQRPKISGKTDAEDRLLLPAVGELRPSRVMPVVADWLARLNPALDRRHLVTDFTMPALLSNAADSVRRIPYFCAGCPHSTSTRVPDGSRAQTGIGCHYMAAWMDRRTGGYIHMGAEGVDWVGRSRFTNEGHVFQNLGDGTYYHSGYLAIRQAIAARANITFKVLYNDAVAMTGGQPVDGRISVAEMARQVEAEGAVRVVVVSDQPEVHRLVSSDFPRGTSFYHRSELDVVQRQLRGIKGVSILIYEQTCAAEKRRRRKRGEFPDPPQRLFINEEVCEGCGDCGEQSNCLAVVPVETPWGRKRAIEQTACNKDFSCLDGFCPSFVTVHDAIVRKRTGAGLSADVLRRELAGVGAPTPWVWSGPFDLLVTGVGGTGVVTVGALVTMAAHLEGKQASVLDFMGFAQKGGAVLSFVRLAPSIDLLNQVRIDTQQADCLLACDLVTGASSDALQSVKHERTQIIVNTHELPTAAAVRDPDANMQAPALLEKMRHAAGGKRVATVDAQAICSHVLGDTMASNILMLGYAWQRGLVPVSAEALQRAIELNGVAVESNRTAFALGRLAAADPAALRRLTGNEKEAVDNDDLDALLARQRQRLIEYQNAAWAERHAALVATVRAAESKVSGGGPLRLTATVARQFLRLMCYKDEYEVARLYAAPEFAARLGEQFSGWSRLSFHMAPPFLAPKGTDGKAPRKLRIGGWALPLLRLLAHGKLVRGTPFDPLGWIAERRLERQLIDDYEATLRELLPALRADNLDLATEIAETAGKIRGYGHVKIAGVAMARARTVALLARWQGV